MKSIFLTFCFLIYSSAGYGSDLKDNLAKINNFHFVSEDLASAGAIELDSYKYIQKYGFKHVINLIPGEQDEERQHVKSLGLSYQQIEVVWSEPGLDDFERFVELMKSYRGSKVFIHCQLNMRASTFVYLYRVTQLGVDQSVAKKDLLRIWKPNKTWQKFIDKVIFSYTED